MSAPREVTDPQAELFGALARAQGNMKAPKASRRGGHGNGYSTFEDLMAVAVPALAAEAIAISQTSRREDGGVLVVTRLLHQGGGVVESEAWVPFDVKGRSGTVGPHAIGGALTYGRRYTLSMVVGIGADCGDDDDGYALQDEMVAARRAAPKKAAPKKAAPKGDGRKVFSVVCADLNLAAVDVERWLCRTVGEGRLPVDDEEWEFASEVVQDRADEIRAALAQDERVLEFK